jgi:hypothetical protein
MENSPDTVYSKCVCCGYEEFIDPDITWTCPECHCRNEERFIKCHGDCENPARIRIHKDLNQKPKKKPDPADQLEMDPK